MICPPTNSEYNNLVLFVGKFADFVIMNRNYEIEEVYVHGSLVYKN